MIIATTQTPQWSHWFAFLLIFVVAALFSVGLRRLSKSGGAHRIRRWVPVAHVVVWAVAIAFVVVAVASQGITSALIVVILALGGLLVAARGWLRNVFAGLVLFSEADIARGDRIEVGDCRGEVLSIGVRSVQLRDVDGVVHDVPHAEFVEHRISRFADVADAACEIELELMTDAEAADVLEMVRLIAARAPLASPRRRPRAYLERPPRQGEPLQIRVQSYPFSVDHRQEYRSDVMRRVHQHFDRF